MRETELRAILHMTPLEHRFWAKVTIIDDDTSCWEWSRGRHPDGYGMFQWTPPGEAKSRAVQANRVSLFLKNGCVPEVACHHCDNPPCVRPSHLYDGTHQSNGADKAARGRARGRIGQRGEANSIAVLTDDLVRQARTLYREERLSYAAIGKRLSVPGAAIGFAVRGQTWSHITDPLPLQPGEERKGSARLTQTEVGEVLALRSQGALLKEIASRYGVTESAISHLCRHAAPPLGS